METIWTIGHSTRAIEEFLAILNAHSIERLADVRTVPRSRYNPQFNRDVLPQSLAAQGIEYEHLPGLGGLRHARPDSANTGWRNASFRGYADYMQTREFQEHLAHLIALAAEKRTVIMCAEAVPWRCHRSLVGDALLVRGISVEHILNAAGARPHTLTPFAHVDGTAITYETQLHLSGE